MRVLVDTNALLWWLFDLPQLGARARQRISSAEVVMVSAISAAEISVKSSLGKLEAPADLEFRLEENAFSPLPLTMRHSLELQSLPHLHRDPFDRLLIAQARCEGLTIITGDQALAAYDVPVIDARL